MRAREHTCETVTVRGVPVWRSGTRYFPSPLEVLETPWIQYCVLLPREEDDPTWTQFHPTNGAALAALFGDQAGTAAGTALTHMEWFLREDGTVPGQRGRRAPARRADHAADGHRARDRHVRRLGRAHRARPLHARSRASCAAGAAFFRGQGARHAGGRVTGVERGHRGVRRRARRDAPAQGRPAARRRLRGRGLRHRGHATTDGAKRALRALIEHIQVRYG